MSSRVVLVTGASTGFGRDTVESLARAGHTVFASMRNIATKNRAHAQALRQLAAGEELRITPVELDVTSDVSVERATEAILRASGRIDVLINNAGVASAGVSESFTAAQAAALFDVNVIGVHRVTRAALPALRRQKEGLVINISSILGRVTFPFFGIYGASKFAVEALTESYRYELSAIGVEVVLVEPSAYPTAMYSSVQRPADAGRAAEYGRVGEIPSAMFQRFMDVFNGPNPPNPHDVATAILRLIDMPKGSRPARTVVGLPFGADVVNEQTAPVQKQAVEALGLGHLTGGPR
jgi:NAD(P)-dependent dehydrogenase (short-subunit alcohol dehydrogenase family)